MDVIVKCLLQPGQLRNQLHKSMHVNSSHLLILTYPDSSCCRDKVNRAAGRRTGVMPACRLPAGRRVRQGFCRPSGQFTVTGQLASVYRDWQKTRQP